jgi:hypothetical protein
MDLHHQPPPHAHTHVYTHTHSLTNTTPTHPTSYLSTRRRHSSRAASAPRRSTCNGHCTPPTTRDSPRCARRLRWWLHTHRTQLGKRKRLYFVTNHSTYMLRIGRSALSPNAPRIRWTQHAAHHPQQGRTRFVTRISERARAARNTPPTMLTTRARTFRHAWRRVARTAAPSTEHAEETPAHHPLSTAEENELSDKVCWFCFLPRMRAHLCPCSRRAPLYAHLR